MKRLVLTLAALAAVAAPLSIATTADAQGRNNDRREYNDNRGRNDGRYDNNRRGNDNRQWDNNRRGGDNRNWDNNRRGNDRDWDRGRNDNRRWDNSRYNGYYLGNQWYYGPPAVAYYDRYDYRPDYRAWQRGGYLPPSYRGYVVYDYGRYRLRQPPRGYQWVRANNDYILAAIATGLILEVIAGNY